MPLVSRGMDPGEERQIGESPDILGARVALRNLVRGAGIHLPSHGYGGTITNYLITRMLVSVGMFSYVSFHG